MAAVICNGIGDLCKAICCLPCRACEFICTAPCKLCAKICCSPLAGYVAVTLVSHLPILGVGAKGLVGWGSCSDDNVYLWLLVMVITSAIHILAALYLAIRIQNSNDAAMAELTTGIERASYLLCHDLWMALYILVWIFFAAWLILGGVWFAGSPASPSDACVETMDSFAICLGFGWFYFVAGPCALTLSLCCTACCDNRDYTAGNNQSLPTTTNSTTVNNNNINEPSAPAAVVPLPPPKKFEDPTKVYDAQGVIVTDYPNSGGADVPVAYAEAVPATAPVEDADNKNPFFSEGMQNSVNQFMSQFTASNSSKK